MSDPINVAIIGAGIGREHLDAYRALPGLFDVRTICDVNKARAAEIIADGEQIDIETDFANVLKDENIDLIDICLPPHLHYQMSMDALASGKHVVCEKPLVSSIKEADDLIAQADNFDKILTPVFQYRFGSEMAKLRALIDSGLAGKPFIATIETHWHRDKDYYDNPWRGTWKGEQGGAVLGHAIHNHDFLCAVLGPVCALSAMVATRVNDIETEDCAAINFEMDNGALATSSITLGAANDRTRFRFCFENLTAESDLLPYAPASGQWRFTPRGKTTQSDIDAILSTCPPSKTGFEGFFEALYLRLKEGVDHGGNNSVSISDGRQSLELVSAIYKAAASGRKIHLPLEKEDIYYSGWTPDHLT